MKFKNEREFGNWIIRNMADSWHIIDLRDIGKKGVPDLLVSDKKPNMPPFFIELKFGLRSTPTKAQQRHLIDFGGGVFRIFYSKGRLFCNYNMASYTGVINNEPFNLLGKNQDESILNFCFQLEQKLESK